MGSLVATKTPAKLNAHTVFLRLLPENDMAKMSISVNHSNLCKYYSRCDCVKVTKANLFLDFIAYKHFENMIQKTIKSRKPAIKI